MGSHRKILFCGSLPPIVTNGVTISNMINLKILSNAFDIDYVTEETMFHLHNKLAISKILAYLKSIINIIKKANFNKYEYFYLVFSVSLFGSLKTLFSILSFRIFNDGKIILHIHRGDFFTHFYTNSINKLLASIVFSNCYKIILLSDVQKTEFQNVFKNHKFHALPNTIEIEHSCELVNFSKYENRKDYDYKFLYISNYLIDKGIIDLLTVFENLCEKFPKITLQTYGAFTDQKMKNEIIKFESQNIKIGGIVTGIEKFEILKQYDCLILPSWNEGMPLILLEAMSVGTLVISTNVGLIPDLLGGKYPYLCYPKDRESLEKNILKFIDSNFKSELSKEMATKYNSQYSQKTHAHLLHNIFSQPLN